MNTIIGIFRNGIDVERALFDLEQSGFNLIAVLDHEQEHANPPARWFGIDDRGMDVDSIQQDIALLQEMRVPDAAAYAGQLQHGYKLVIVQSSSEQVRELLDILCEANAITEPAAELM
jgi:hypothetical protein